MPLKPGVLFFAAALSLDSAANAQPQLLDPNAKLSTTPVRVSIAPEQPSAIKLPSPEDVGRTVSALLTQLDQITSEIAGQQVEIGTLDKKLGKLSQDLAALAAERDRALDDLRKGHFCSTCGKAKSQFPSDAAFWSHIAEGASSGRRALGATPDQVAAKEREFTDKLAAIEAERSAASDERTRKIDETRTDFEDARRAAELLRIAALAREAAIIAREEQARDQDKADLARAEKRIDEIGAERRALLSAGPVPPEDVKRLADEERTWQRVKSNVNEQAQFRGRAYWSDLTAAREAAGAEYRQALGHISRTQETFQQLSLANPWTRPITVPLPGGSIDWNQAGITINAGGGSVSWSADGSPSMSLPFGPQTTMNVKASRLDAASTELKGYVEIFGRLRLGLTTLTRHQPDGFPTIETRPLIELTKGGGEQSKPDLVVFPPTPTPKP